MERAEENFVVGKSMLFHENSNRIIRLYQFFGKLHGADIIQIFQKCLTGIFFKQAAEVLAGDGQGSGSLIKCERFLVVGPDPFHDFCDPLPVPVIFHGKIRRSFGAVIPAKKVQEFV